MNTTIGDLLPPLAIAIAISPVAIIATILMLMGGSRSDPESMFSRGGGFSVYSLPPSCSPCWQVFFPSRHLTANRWSGGHFGYSSGSRSWDYRCASGVHDRARGGASRAFPRGCPRSTQCDPPLRWEPRRCWQLSIRRTCFLRSPPVPFSDPPGWGTGGVVVCGAVFVAVASASIALPTIAYLVSPGRAEPVLASLRSWLVANNTAIMCVLLIVLGTKLLGDGIGAL